jgi:hypothetical protein
MQIAARLSVVVGKRTLLAALHKLIGSKALPLSLLQQLSLLAAGRMTGSQGKDSIKVQTLMTGGSQRHHLIGPQRFTSHAKISMIRRTCHQT